MGEVQWCRRLRVRYLDEAAALWRRGVSYINWETLLISLSADPAAMDQAVSRIRPHFDGHDLLDVADVVRQTVPAGDPLRVIMDAEMGQRP
jgi:hypothetical protein